MSANLIGAVMLVYLWVAYTYWDGGRLGMMLTFIGYSLANIGLIIDYYEIAK